MGKFKVVAAVSNMHLPNVKEIGTVVEPNHPGYISQEEFLGLVKSSNPDGIITFPMNKIDKEVLDLAPNLKAVATFSVGFDHIDREECKKRGVKVGYLPGILTECVAETAIALLLATARRIPQNVALARKWEQCWPEWHVFMFSGNQIEGSTVGIYGLGRIGTSVMEKLLPFHPNKIIYHDIIKKEGINAEYVSFEDLVAKSDFLIITVAVTGDAKGKFNKEILSKMKQGSILINTARGSVINSEDLYEALKSGHLGGAGLDVTDPEPLPATHPLFTLDNCVILPHIGSATIETRHKMLKLTEDNLINGLLGKEMPAPLPL